MMDEKTFNVVRINQNGKRIIEKEGYTAYAAHKLCREYNNALRVNNPSKIRKYVPEEATE